MTELATAAGIGVALFIGFGVHIVFDVWGIRKALEAIRDELEKHRPPRIVSDAGKEDSP